MPCIAQVGSMQVIGGPQGHTTQPVCRKGGQGCRERRDSQRACPPPPGVGMAWGCRGWSRPREPREIPPTPSGPHTLLQRSAQETEKLRKRGGLHGASQGATVDTYKMMVKKGQYDKIGELPPIPSHPTPGCTYPSAGHFSRKRASQSGLLKSVRNSGGAGCWPGYIPGMVQGKCVKMKVKIIA